MTSKTLLTSAHTISPAYDFKTSLELKAPLPKRVQTTFLYDQPIGKKQEGRKQVIVKRSGTLHMHLERDDQYHYRWTSIEVDPADPLKRITAQHDLHITPRKLYAHGEADNS